MKADTCQSLHGFGKNINTVWPKSIRRLRVTFTVKEKREFVHVTKFSLYLPFTVHYNYTEIGRLTPVPLVLAVFYLLISYFKNLLIWISRLPFAVNAMLNLSIICWYTFKLHSYRGYVWQLVDRLFIDFSLTPKIPPSLKTLSLTRMK